MLQIIFHTILCAAFSLEWIIRIVVSDCCLLNEKSHKICREDSLSGKNMFYKNVTGNNLMMTLYFSCLLECAELLIDIFSLAAFLNIPFQRWPWQIGSNTLTRHLISQIQKQLTNCGRIKALKPLDVQETMKRLISCLFVPWSITVLILTLRRWDIFSSPKSVFVHQWYKLQTIFFCVSLWYVLGSDVSTNYHCFRRFIYLQDLQNVSLCTCLFISCRMSLNSNC